MYLYDVSVVRPQAVLQALSGNFSDEGAHEVVVSHGSALELLRPDGSGRLQSVACTEAFCVVRSIAALRVQGARRDLVVVGSDSGNVAVLEFSAEKNAFVRVVVEPYGKTGCRRIVPGQYVAADPRGRAVMVAAVEKQKLVFQVTRNHSGDVSLLSAREAHRSHAIVFAVAGLDVGFDNPTFACLEIEYAEADADPSGSAARDAVKHLVYYELDLSSNVVLRRWSAPVSRSAHMLIPLPHATEGAAAGEDGGVLVCSEGSISWMREGVEPVCVAIPRRAGDSVTAPPPRVIAPAMLRQREQLALLLLQTTAGDLLRVGVSDGALQVGYFDTVAPASTLCVLRSGYLFVGSEFGSHQLHHFQSLGEAPTGVAEEYSVSATPTYLRLVDELPSVSPVLDMKVAQLFGDSSKEIYAACGRGPRSSLRVLRHGVAMETVAEHQLQGAYDRVWSLKASAQDEHHSFLVASSSSETIVLSIGDTIEQVLNGFLHNVATLACGLMSESLLVQVHGGGFVSVFSGNVNLWAVPQRKQVTHACMNGSQLLLVLGGRELMLFEVDDTGLLNEVLLRNVGRDVLCVAIAPVPAGAYRGSFAAFGDEHAVVEVISLNPSDHLGMVSVQRFATEPESLAMYEVAGESLASGEISASLNIAVGLRNGVLLRATVRYTDGTLLQPRTRPLGTDPVRLFVLPSFLGGGALVAVSGRPWLLYMHQFRQHLVPFSVAGSRVDAISPFQSQSFSDGMVSIGGGCLRIFAPERYGEEFSQIEIPLRYTPRRLAVHAPTRTVVVVESDHAAVGAPAALRGAPLQTLLRDAAAGRGSTTEGELRALEQQIGERAQLWRATGTTERSSAGQWASRVQLLSPLDARVRDWMEFQPNEAAHTVCTVVFHEHGDEVFVVVGTVCDLRLQPRSCSGGALYTYAVEPDGSALRLVHRTPLEDMPGAVAPFHGRLLVGVGTTLRLYDLGRSRLLRKCERGGFPTLITSVQALGTRVVVGDLAESFHFVKYLSSENELVPFADDSLPRWTTCGLLLDASTVAGGDKFGNLFVLRLPADADERAFTSGGDGVGGGGSGDVAAASRGSFLNGAAVKLDAVASYYLGDTVTSLAKTELMAGGAECIVYGTLLGRVGVLYPLTTRADVDFLSHLEMDMRTHLPTLCARDHLAYRSYYAPNKAVIDGNLCEMFAYLPAAAQADVVSDLDLAAPSDVLHRLETIRQRIL